MFQFNPLFSGYLGQQYMATLPYLEPYTMKNFSEKNISSGAQENRKLNLENDEDIVEKTNLYSWGILNGFSEEEMKNTEN